MAQVDNKKPAFIGGAIVGLLSVMPILQMANLCFCLWALVGGAVAAKILIDSPSLPLTSRDGARIGLLAGLVGGVIYFLIETPITIWSMGNILESASNLPIADQNAVEFYHKIQQSQALKIIFAFLFVFLGTIFLVGFTVIGGMLGVAIFEKRKGQFPPPQYPPQYPPNYPPQSGGDGGSGGSGDAGGQGGWPQS